MAMVDELKVRLAERRRIAEPGRPSSMQQLKLFTSPENKTQGLAWEPGRVGPNVPETVVEAWDGDLEADIQRLRCSSPKTSQGSSGLGRSSSCTATATKTGVSGKAKRKLLQQQLADVSAERDGAIEENMRLHEQLIDALSHNEALQTELQTLRRGAPSEMHAATLDPVSSELSPSELAQQPPSPFPKAVQDEHARQLVQEMRAALEDVQPLLAGEEEHGTLETSASTETACSGRRLKAIQRVADVLASFPQGGLLTGVGQGAEPARAPRAAEGSWLGASLAARGPRMNLLSKSMSVPVLEDSTRRPSRDGCAPAELKGLAHQLRGEREYWLEALQD